MGALGDVAAAAILVLVIAPALVKVAKWVYKRGEVVARETANKGETQ